MKPVMLLKPKKCRLKSIRKTVKTTWSPRVSNKDGEWVVKKLRLYTINMRFN
jgi:hypothetical protein